LFASGRKRSKSIVFDYFHFNGYGNSDQHTIHNWHSYFDFHQDKFADEF
jgi:hypothetical protein